jgi:hypothetical protein
LAAEDAAAADAGHADAVLAAADAGHADDAHAGHADDAHAGHADDAHADAAVGGVARELTTPLVEPE